MRCPVRSTTAVLVGSVLVGSALLVSACTSGVERSDAPTPRDAAVVRALPPPTTDGTASLEQALSTRRSQRDFTAASPTDAQVGQLLWAAQGVTAPWGGRTSPSAGGIYPLEVYAVTREEVWHYRPDGHRVEVWPDAAAAPAVAGAVGQEAATGAPLLVVVTGVVSRTEEEYGDRAERYVLMEVGHATQNLLLQATALGLGGVPIGAFDDDAIAAALALPSQERPYYVVPVGAPAGDTPAG